MDHFAVHLASGPEVKKHGVPKCSESDDRVELSISLSIVLCKEVAELCAT